MTRRSRGGGAGDDKPARRLARASAALLVACVASAGLVGCTRSDSTAPTQRPPVQVVVVEAKRQPVVDRLPGIIGTVTANETVEVKTEIDGVVQEISFEEGQPVEKGQLLVQLDDRKARAALAEAEAMLKLSTSNLERSKELYKDKLISQQEFDQASSSYALNAATVDLRKRLLQDTRVYAPFEGVAGTRLVSPGQVITRNSTITWVVDLDPVKVELNAPERFLSQVQPGQTIEITVAAYPDRKFHGTVYFVSPYVDESTRKFLVKAKVPNRTGALKPGMFANLDLTLTVKENAVVIPEVAVQQMSEKDGGTVYVVDSDLTVRAQRVQFGFIMPGRIEIVKGLNGGEKVIVEGLQKVGPGSKVKLAPPESSLPYERLGDELAAPGASG